MAPHDLISFLIEAFNVGLDPKLAVVLPDEVFEISAKIAMLLFIWLTPFFIAKLLADRNASPEVQKLGFYAGIGSAVLYTGLIAQSTRSLIALWTPLLGFNAGLRFLGTFGAVRSFFAAHPILRFLIVGATVTTVVLGFSAHDPTFWALNLVLTVISGVLTIVFAVRLSPDRPELALTFGVLAVTAGLIRPEAILEPRALEIGLTAYPEGMWPNLHRFSESIWPALARVSFLAFKGAFLVGICFGVSSRVFEPPGSSAEEFDVLERWGAGAGVILLVVLLSLIGYGTFWKARDDTTRIMETTKQETRLPDESSDKRPTPMPMPTIRPQIEVNADPATDPTSAEQADSVRNVRNGVSSASGLSSAPARSSEITASELVRTFQQDARSANGQYQGQSILVTGLVEKVGKDFVSLKDKTEATKSVRCKCAVGGCGWLADVRVGSMVKLSGIVTGKRITGRIDMDGCELIH